MLWCLGRHQYLRTAKEMTGKEIRYGFTDSNIQLAECRLELAVGVGYESRLGLRRARRDNEWERLEKDQGISQFKVYQIMNPQRKVYH